MATQPYALRLIIESFGGIPSANLAIRPGLTLVAGTNGSGKSTIMRAIVACARADSAIPIIKADGKDALLKKDSLLLVQGTGGSVTLESYTGSRRVSYPKNTARVTKEGPFPGGASRMALGMVDWMAMTDRDRLFLLGEYVAKEPAISMAITREDVDKAVDQQQIDPQIGDWLWNTISKYGMEAANKYATTSFSEATGAWGSYTGTKYGSDKIKNYYPDGYGPDLLDDSQEGLEQTIRTATAAVEQAVGNMAVDANWLTAQEAIAAQTKPDFKALEAALANASATNADAIKGFQNALRQYEKEPESITKIRGALVGIRTELQEKEQTIREIENGITQLAGVCPHCNTKLRIVKALEISVPGGPEGRYELGLYDEGASPAQLAQAKEEKSTLLSKKREAEETISNHATTVITSRSAVQADLDAALKMQRGSIQFAEKKLLEAREKLAEINSAEKAIQQARAKGTGVTREQVDLLRHSQNQAVARLAAWESKRNADIQARLARQWAVLKTITSVTGLSKTKLDQGLGQINGRLADISRVAKWGHVAITPNADLQYAGRPYVILSQAEQYRCRVTLQVMLGLLEKTPILLFDGADILDSAGRQGLVTLLRSLPITSVVAMTAKRDYVLTVAKMFGATFWVERGVVTPILTAAAAPAASPPPPTPPPGGSGIYAGVQRDASQAVVDAGETASRTTF